MHLAEKLRDCRDLCAQGKDADGISILRKVQGTARGVIWGKAGGVAGSRVEETPAAALQQDVDGET